MPVRLRQFDSLPSPANRRAWRCVDNSPLIVATCFSLLLHALLLTVYDQRKSAENGELPSALGTSTLNVRFRVLPANDAMKTQDAVEKNTRNLNLPFPARTTGNRIDAAEKSNLTEPQTVTSIPASDAGNSATTQESSRHVDIEAAYKLARQLARVQDQNLAQQSYNQVPSRMNRETPLARAVANSVAPDCRTAYAGAGLLAIFPLIIGAVTDSGCRW